MAGRFPQRDITMDFGKGSIALAGATAVAVYNALKTGGGYTPALLAATLLVIINLALGVHVSAAAAGPGAGRRHRTIAFVNFCACFVPLIIAMANGGEFKPELVKKIYDALV